MKLSECTMGRLVVDPDGQTDYPRVGMIMGIGFNGWEAVPQVKWCDHSLIGQWHHDNLMPYEE